MVTVLGANTLSSGGFEVANSCRFDGSSSSMSITPGSNMNLDRWTWSGWIKRSSIGVLQSILAADNAASDTTLIEFDANDKLNFLNLVSNNIKGKKITDRVFRDISAWYHIVVVWDSANSTAADRIKIYVNGVRETSFATSDNPDSGVDSSLGESGVATLIGTYVGEDSRFFNGYLAEVVLIDGSALAPTSFGEFDEDSGIWKPIKVSGLTFGTHGFYLDFQASGNLGNDANGGTDLGESGLAAVDQSTDTCTNNFATMNPLIPGQTNYTYSDGNLTITQGSAAWVKSNSTFGMSSGKWYWEGKWVSGNYTVFAVDNTDTAAPYSATSNSAVGYKRNGNVEIGTDPQTDIAAYAHGDTVSVALDMDNDAVYFYKNGAIQNSGDPTSGASKTGAYALPVTNSTYFANISPYGSGATTMNFGSPPYAISSSNADEDGFGNFEYAVPAGYFALCSKNLAEYG